MAGFPPKPPYPPPPSGPGWGPAGVPPGGDWRYQRRILKDQARVQRDAARQQRDFYRMQARGMRRGSIAGPLLMIAVGVIFLLVQTGHLEATRFWGWYGRWWPLLLVGIGAILLAEWGFDQFARRNQEVSQPYPRRVLGGGLTLLLVLLVGSGLLFSAVRNGEHSFLSRGFNINQDNLDEFMGNKHESDEASAMALPKDMDVVIDSPRGDVTVSGTSDDNQIHVSTHREVYSRSDADASEKARQILPKMDVQNGVMKVSVGSVQGGRADLTITIPPVNPVTVNANHGDVRVRLVKAPVQATANHGDMELSAITGPVDARINNGDASFSAHSITGPVRVEGRGGDLTLSDITGPTAISGEFFGTTHLERLHGPIKFHTSRTDLQLIRLDGQVEISGKEDLSADRVQGPMILNTRNRNVTLDRIAGDISVTNRNGSVDLMSAPPMGNVTIENRNGSVNMTVPDEAAFSVRAETTDGDAENDFSLPDTGSDTHKSFGGTVGKGGSLIRISTSQGDVSLKKARIAPLPPAPPAPPRLTMVPPDTREAIQEAKEAAREAAQAAREAAREAEQQAKEAARDGQERAREARQEAEEKAREAKQEAAEKAREVKQDAAEKAREAKQQADEARREARDKQ